jgi:hypothetical protein
MKLLACALLLSACAADESHNVVGTRADMTTQAGDYDGYSVLTACTDTWADVGVVGTGHVELTAQKDISSAAQDLHAQLADITSVWGGFGYGLACTSHVGTQVALDDWHDVDTVIARTGAWLRDNDYSLQVGISVESIPSPASGN